MRRDPLAPGRAARGRLMVAGLVVAAALVLACGLPSRPEQPAQAPPPVAPATVEPAPAADAAGVWEGYYRCPQGVTGLTLTIAGAAADGLTATFRFYPIPDNPTAAAGSFAMTGDQRGTQIRLEPDHWLEQPAGYLMVGLAGELSAPGPAPTFTGTVDSQGCTGFELEWTGASVSGTDETIAGTWEGYYRCGVTERGLALVVTPAEQGVFRASFEFFPVPGSSSSESGVFAMTGHYSRFGMVARPDYWIEQPPGYIMVGLSAPVDGDGPERMAGSVDAPNCHSFELDKVSDQWSAPRL